MLSKKGQKEGMAVAFIIGAILVFTIIYILVAPPEVREQLLNQSDLKTISIEKSNLLSESPGKLTLDNNQITAHKIPNINLYFKTEPKVTALANQLEVYRSWFSKKYPALKFNINDLKNLKSVDLFFSIKEADGDLEVYLNNKPVYEGELSTGIQSVSIPLSYLQEENELTLETNFPFFPWSSNDYIFTDVSLKQKFELINSQEEKSIKLQQEELDSLESAELYYTQLCNIAPKSPTDLRILLNDQELYNSEIFCVNTDQTIDVPNEYLQIGLNNFTFIIEAGDFLLTEVTLDTKSNNANYPTYYFKVTEDQLSAINNGDATVLLDTILSKQGTKELLILVNENKLDIKTKEVTYSADISASVKQGTNIIRIIPANTFTLVALNVNIAA